MLFCAAGWILILTLSDRFDAILFEHGLSYEDVRRHRAKRHDTRTGTVRVLQYS